MPGIQNNRPDLPPPGDPQISTPADGAIEPDGTPAPASLQNGAAVIRRHWEHAPAGPGVYRMTAANGEVLYVGKANSVRKRIASYLRPISLTARIVRMIQLTA